MIWILSPLDRAQNSDKFTFLKFENPSTGSKSYNPTKLGTFCPKMQILGQFHHKNKSNIVETANKLLFLAHKFGPHDKKYS